MHIRFWAVVIAFYSPWVIASSAVANFTVSDDDRLKAGSDSSRFTTDISSYAFVNDDGTLRIRSRTIHLFGIYIPPSNTLCRSFTRPVKCAPRAALALDFKIGPDFVRCDIKGKNLDGSLVAVCRANGEDLAAYLLQRGWAAALPEAPPEYAILERIARSRGLGVWGIPIDNVIR
jgi:endonuclease YncB( thermonuclease family)